MMKRFGPTAGILLIALPAVVACSSNNTRLRPLPPMPAGPVQSQPLPPAPASARAPESPPPVSQTEEPQQQAAVQPANDAPTQESVLGQWALAGPGDSCQLFVTLTGWTGGYRASTRGCTSPELTSVGAWNIEGNLVVLKDNEGNSVARLAKSGATQYNGRLDLGGNVSMSR